MNDSSDRRLILPRHHRVAMLASLMFLAACLRSIDGFAAGPAPPPLRPNIVIIVADDMGYSDLGCYGSEINTSNIDRLAARGLRFTNFYNAGVCCPTRAALMTGLYSWQAGIGHMMEDFGTSAYRGDLNQRCVTIAEMLRQANYGTYMSGKWHLTRFQKPEGPWHNWPRQRGFDNFFGTIAGSGSYFQPPTLTVEDVQVEKYPDDMFYTHSISDQAVQFISRHESIRPDDPLFLYVAYTAPHFPLQALRSDIERYQSLYHCGWDELRQFRFKFMKKMGLFPSDAEPPPRDPAVPAWSEIAVERQRQMSRYMSVYAGQIDEIDQGVGRIIQALKVTKRFENTLIFVLSDNGAEDAGGPMGFEMNVVGRLSTEDSCAAYGQAWANVSNTPFRGYKGDTYEGGICTPLIVHWPEHIAEQQAIRRSIGHVIDIMPTCLEVSGASYPKEVEGELIHPLAGMSLTPTFAGRALPERPLFWGRNGNRAIRLGRWKLTAQGSTGRWELYDLDADRFEQRNVAAKQPQLVARLSKQWEDWANRVGVLPWPAIESDSESFQPLEANQDFVLPTTPDEKLEVDPLVLTPPPPPAAPVGKREVVIATCLLLVFVAGWWGSRFFRGREQSIQESIRESRPR